MVPISERGAYLGFNALSWALGTVIAPIIGAAFTQSSASWRWCFWINLPLCAIAFILIFIFLNLQQDISSVRSKLGRIDYLGAAVFTASAVSLLMSLSWGGSLYAWSSWHTLVPLLLGIAGLGLFVLIEYKFAKEPMIPLPIFNTRTASAGFLGTFLHGAFVWCLIYYWSIYFQGAKMHSVLISGVDALPLTLTVAPFAAITGILNAVTQRYLIFVWIGWAVTVTGTGLFTLLDQYSDTANRIGLLLLGGIGSGIIFPAIVFACQVPQKDEYVGIATSAMTFFRSFGMIFGVGAIGGSVFENSWNTYIEGDLSQLPADLQVDGTQALSIIPILPTLSVPLQDLLRACFADSVRVIWYVMIGLTGLGFVITIFMKDLPLDNGVNTSKQQFVEHPKHPSEGQAQV